MAKWSDYFVPDVGAALPEGYGAKAPIMDPLANAAIMVGNTLAIPGQAYNSRAHITTEQMVKPAADLAGMVTLGAGAMPAEANALRAGAKVRRPSDFVEPQITKAEADAARAAGPYKPLEGLPQGPYDVGGEPYVAGPISTVHDVAKQYMDTAGRPYERQPHFQPVDKERAAAIAKAFEDMKHAPDNPAVRAAYDAMINETRDQYRALTKSGVKIEPITPDMTDPYLQTPRLAQKDVRDNNHLWFFPTEQGFGSNPQGAIDMATHPMMQPSGEMLNGQPLLNNDLFRVVHDYFGHLKEGHGFRGAGEDNAFQTHARMYSDQARPAMATETRGQNSWLNYGPHGETNRTAKSADTVFADQKVGVMPAWTRQDAYYPGRRAPADFFDAPNPHAPFPQYSETYPPVGPGTPTIDKKTGKEFLAKELTPEALAVKDARTAATADMARNGYQPYFDPADRFYPDPSHYPPNVDTTTLVPKKQSTIDKDMATIGTPEVRQRLQEAYKRGSELPDTNDWYALGQLEKKFVDELGPVEGRKAFQDRFATSMAATTGGTSPTDNLMMAQYGNYLRTRGLPYPEAAHEMPYPIGGRYATTNMEMHKRVMDNGGFADLGAENPKRHNFAQNFTGNRDAATIDEQMANGMTPGAQRPAVGKYGLYEQVLRDEAEKAGVKPANFQDVAWAGFKSGKPIEEQQKGRPYTAGKPMIQEVNDAIERTHRLTGLPRNEIVRRGLVRGEIPLYGVAGAAMAAPSLADFLDQPPASRP